MRLFEESIDIKKNTSLPIFYTFWCKNNNSATLLSKVTKCWTVPCIIYHSKQPFPPNVFLIPPKKKEKDFTRPVKNVYFPASKSEFPSSLTKFSSSIAYFPYVFLYIFSQNHKISRQEACQIAHFFPPCWIKCKSWCIIFNLLVFLIHCIIYKTFDPLCQKVTCHF